MSLHTIKEYLKYRRKAMGRHGTHSPFVYALVEDCIQQHTELPLPERICTYLKDWPATELPAQSCRDWNTQIDHYNFPADERRLIIVPAIHSSPAHTQSWAEICQKPSIRYSIDLYDFGLLLINPDFKEKQHFVLKNR